MQNLYKIYDKNVFANVSALWDKDGFKARNIMIIPRDNQHYAFRGNYDVVLQRILPTTVL